MLFAGFRTTMQLCGYGSPLSRLCEKSVIFCSYRMASVAETSSSFSGGGWGECLQQRRDSENVDDPFEIVVQHPQGQFGFGFSQSLDQESGLGHQPFHRPKRMLGRFPPLLHPNRIGDRPLVRLLAAEPDKGAAYPHDRSRVVLAEVRNGLERRRQAIEQPHHLNVAPRFRLQPPARPHPVQVAINIQLQKIPRRVRRPPHLFRSNLGKSQSLQIEPVYKGINHPHRIVTPNHLVQNLRKKRRLVPRLPRDVRHHDPESKPDSRLHQPNNFSHSLVRGDDVERLLRQMPKYAACTCLLLASSALVPCMITLPLSST